MRLENILLLRGSVGRPVFNQPEDKRALLGTWASPALAFIDDSHRRCGNEQTLVQPKRWPGCEAVTNSFFAAPAESDTFRPMSERLHELLQQDEPTALAQIERALASQTDRTADQEAVLNALIWRRCTNGAAGFLGTVLHQNCASLIDVLPSQLARIGAADAAVAIRELRDVIPLEDEQIKRGLADWIETKRDVVNKAHELEAGLEDITPTIWEFMKSPSSEMPDIEISSRTEDIVSSVVSFFRSSPED